ncbi:SGNH/GDSL hydrolase family protein [Geodermatophilus sabuli]|uniref:Lysophospholipase L1 n=1 Tax=Geodermatophilus sabuli TaxID=1564158 RepID=A0A285EG89_9ACTN|nr:SGNH/GDSL hydrolase family protein [Geodermatophilus sabuli]MBB3083225.1 lysophospholipase L1-like esterase [Geodermatophilus sabuli]SNX97051.1 Lysophospholipase L1 [Geodermatophilus sabuli]
MGVARVIPADRSRSSGGGRWDRPPAWALVAMALCLAGLIALGPSVLRSGTVRAAGAAESTATATPAAPHRPTEVLVERPADRPLRVLFIGDSLMWGSFASDPSLTYRALVTAGLSTEGPVDAVLVGGPGESAAEATEGLTEVTGPFDLVFVEVGANDSVALTPARFSSDYAALLDGVRALAPDAALVCDGVWNGPDLATPLDRELRPVCAARGGVVVPLSPLYVDETLRGPEGSPVPGGGVRDQFHPNDAGHAAIAEAMLAVLGL